MATPLQKQIFKKWPPPVLPFAKGKWQSGFRSILKQSVTGGADHDGQDDECSPSMTGKGQGRDSRGGLGMHGHLEFQYVFFFFLNY